MSTSHDFRVHVIFVKLRVFSVLILWISLIALENFLYDYYHQLFLIFTFRLSYSQSMQSILMSIDDNEVPNNLAILSRDDKRPEGDPKKSS